ncbi:MAG: hypothetical protein KKE39_07225 [Bacteroidetes bacterium]|nr:hypothetical protein [Bacteroidota bacterium]MBU1372307.1 hypothetical protein [Bacteroidota bacterium]MBU1484059.1 hypothetical protein [Bacteroidota bacterium]MBU1759799.1 hypothetical protein [Bacteroidota bacterium]MBU2268877.1 hypothetical protein [Bacteroidota bacterium]
MITKLIALYVRLKFGNLDWSVKYFYRDTYYCKLVQWKYFFRDYIIKKPYKVVSFSGEFTHDFTYALPFAYWHYKNGTLLRTEGARLTQEMYFFSSNHKEVYYDRTNEGNYNYELPRVLYSHDYNMNKWLAVPYKAHFKNNTYIFEKPPLMIANRYNEEWGDPPISYFSIEMLAYMIEKLKDRYTILYNRPIAKNITSDSSEVYDLKEYDWLRNKYPEVILMEDLYKENKIGANNYNHFQMLVYANIENFISIHGGTCCLASCFGGTNIILSKKGFEAYFGCFEKLYPQLSGTKIFHAKTDEDLKNFIDTCYLN